MKFYKVERILTGKNVGKVKVSFDFDKRALLVLKAQVPKEKRLYEPSSKSWLLEEGEFTSLESRIFPPSLSWTKL